MVAIFVLSSFFVLQHPCDIQNPTVYREPVGKFQRMTVGWCFANTNVDGTPITEDVGFSLQINGGPEIDLGILKPQTAPNAEGEQYYETMAALAPGVLTVKAYTSQGSSGPSAPITLTATNGPKTPTTVLVKPKGT